MFTGIIEEIGDVKRIQKGSDAIVISIRADKVLEDVHLGDSIAVNGVCLTVTSFSKHEFTVDVMPETIKATTLKELTAGSKVNLERAMAANGRFGGHFVSGHIDGVGTIIRKTPKGNAVYYEIEVSSELREFMMLKGSVSVDGTSLTIFGLTANSFTISLIPHTVAHTVIGYKQRGDSVNIECDMLAKYIKEMMTKKEVPSSKGNMYDLLQRHGYTDE
ncbi:riboflavin synthase [Metabacillus iocasae]|uniref:Riboflavin synthase n=1 Tax=Priestia iocasae TaxID=2291674 RepID=A0ABS2QZ58_9BACI|nr:riboflavin synthase [Metabacillus iocasae]MBM7704702.1 riboflavin synthase [Metabacillus iocasae]